MPERRMYTGISSYRRQAVATREGERERTERMERVNCT